MKFITNNSSYATLHIGYKEEYLEERVNTKFLGLQIDNHPNWMNNIEQMIPKISGACYSVKSLVYINNISTLKSIYCAYFLSLIKYGIIFWGYSSRSGKIVTLQKKTIKIMASAQPRTSCISLFKQLEILPVKCQYILSLMSFIISKQKMFKKNSSIHNINTRSKHHLHRPYSNLSCFERSAFFAGIKIFYGLPPSMTILK